MSDHAVLSASGSKKWLVCCPSARLEETFEDEDSEFSKEGTKAHDLMEIALRMYFFSDLPEDPTLKTVEGRRAAGFTAEMDAAVEGLQKRVAEVTQQLDKDKAAYTVFIEHKVDYSQWAEEGFGTADVIVATTKKLWVFDLKYGKGVAVDADDNTQMMLYGLGAWADLSMAYEDIEVISLNIHQPRIGNFSSWEISLTDLLAWGEEYVKPRAALAWEGLGDFVPGDHCASGFCKARFTCQARASDCLEMSAGLTRPELMTTEDIAALLPKLDSIEKWAKGLKDYAQKTAIEDSVRYPGWKLVEGKSYRYVANKDEAQRRLKAGGFPESGYLTEPELIGITALEELVGGKKAFTELLGDIIQKPAGKPTLVSDSDKRSVWQGAVSADEEFAG